MTKKRTVKKSADNNKGVALPKVEKAWESVPKATAEQTKAAEGWPEYKGFELWLAPFKTPDKAFRVAPKHTFFIVHIVTWGKRYLVKGGKTKALQMAELA